MIAKIKNNLQSFNEYATLIRRANKYLFVLAGLSFACYIYFVGAITFSVVERQGLEQSNKTLLSDISMQELMYLREEKKLTKEMAYTDGFVDAPTLSFTTRQSAFAWNAGR